MSLSTEETVRRAAEQAFCESGFHGTTVSDIADQAGVGKGTVYRHFGSKARLFAALVEHTTRELIQTLESIIERETEPEEMLRAILWSHFDLFENKRHLVEIIVQEGLDRTGEEIGSVIELWEEYRRLITDVFRQGIEESGRFRPAPPSHLTDLFVGWIWGVLRDRVVFGRDDDPRQYGELMLDMFMEALIEHESSLPS